MIFECSLATARINKMSPLQQAQFYRDLPPVHEMTHDNRSICLKYTFEQFPALYLYLESAGFPTPQLDEETAMRVRGLCLALSPSSGISLFHPLSASTVSSLHVQNVFSSGGFLEALATAFAPLFNGVAPVAPAPAPVAPAPAPVEPTPVAPTPTFVEPAPAPVEPTPAPVAPAPVAPAPVEPTVVEPKVVEPTVVEPTVVEPLRLAEFDVDPNYPIYPLRAFHEEEAKCSQLLDEVTEGKSVLQQYVPTLTHPQEVFVWRVVHALFYYKPESPWRQKQHSTALPTTAYLVKRLSFPQLAPHASSKYQAIVAGPIGLARRRPTPTLPLLSPQSTPQEFLTTFEQLLSFISPRLPNIWDDPEKLLPLISYLFQCLSFFNDARHIPLHDISVPEFFITLIARLEATVEQNAPAYA